MASSSNTQLRRAAQVQALRVRRDLGVGMDQPIDVYRAIRAMRLWLLFEPLEGLFGMYQRYEAAAGVLVNVKVHPALQRYTAAHELGHHVMGHEVGIDPERHITRWTNLGTQELAAQMFAAEFLMPLAAVNAEAATLGIDAGDIDEVGVYQLSLRLRTSYSAMITRLQTMDWIGSSEARRFRSIPPKTVKLRLLGRPPTDPRTDVWLVTDSQKRAAIAPLVGDAVLFSLDETPSTGYRWSPELTEGLSIAKDEFVEPPGAAGEEPIGGTGHRELHVTVDAPTSAHAHFLLRRQWEVKDAAAELDVALDADLRPERGVDVVQQPSLLAV
jgi:predicted secreted protein